MDISIPLSVIIPHLNEPETLRRCLASLAQQQNAALPFEVIVVDNGSTEAPVTVCAAFPGVRLEIERTPGPGPARNTGAAIARSDLLAFIDADCIAAPGWARAIVEAFDAQPHTDVIGGTIRIRPAQADRLTAVEAYESLYSYRNELYVTRYGFSATGNMAVRAQVFAAVGPFGGIATMEDTEWGLRASRMGYRLAYLREATVYTDPCTSFDELTRRWDRHIAHDFRMVAGHPRKVLGWIARGAALAASPLVEIIPIIRTDRVTGLRTRLLAFSCLARVRLYRAKRMLGLIARDNTAAMVGSWNREKS